MTQKVIIDADPGIGDALAIALALYDPNIDVVGITATAGTVSGGDASRNVQTVVENLDPPKWPRLGWCEADIPSVTQQPGFTSVGSSALNGPSGLGDFEFNVADLHHRHESAKLMIDIARSDPDEVTLLTLGPLTNVEVACERAPNFLDSLKGLVCLGGSVSVGGDITAAAEFNMYANPDAARNVLISPATKSLVPLDISRVPILTFEQFDNLSSEESSSLGRFLSQLLPFAFRAHHQHLGLEGIQIQAVVALAAISVPRLFETESMTIDIETQGRLTRGMTVFDRRDVEQWQNNIDVFREVDAQGVFDYLTRILRGS